MNTEPHCILLHTSLFNIENNLSSILRNFALDLDIYMHLVFKYYHTTWWNTWFCISFIVWHLNVSCRMCFNLGLYKNMKIKLKCNVWFILFPWCLYRTWQIVSYFWCHLDFWLTTCIKNQERRMKKALEGALIVLKAWPGF